MKTTHTRRKFLADVGRGMLVATVGLEAAEGLGLSQAWAEENADILNFGALEPLVCLMQETPATKLLPLLVKQLAEGTDLRRLTAAAALANARTFGGEDYVGFHTMMALAPAYHMAQELPAASRPLPVFKVLYRNTARIQERGGRKEEVLRLVQPATISAEQCGGETLREQTRKRDLESAERIFAALAQGADGGFNDLLWAVQDTTEVHRVVMPYRAWDLVGLIGQEQAHTLLRQSVRYCVRTESATRPVMANDPRTLLPKLLEEHKLLDRPVGTQRAEDEWVEKLSQTFFTSTPEQAAGAAAAALAEGIAPDAIGEAIALAANQLVLRDHGRTPREEQPGKLSGSVHGDSIGVHASDSANAWRNMARVSNARNTMACLILGAYQVALDRTARGGDFQNWEPLPARWHREQIKLNDGPTLLRETEEAIRQNLQARAAALIGRYGDLDLPVRPVFDLLLRYAISEDGALHAEKFYRTVVEEFNASRPAYRWRYLIGLARVTASEFGRPAPGVEEARLLLSV